jgi:hypothetical protein
VTHQPADQQAAEELDALIRARQGGGAPSAADHLPPDAAALAAALLELAETSAPDPTASAELAARLHTVPLPPAASSSTLRHQRPAYRWPLWVAVAVLVLGLLLAVPPVRATVLDIVRVGAITIAAVVAPTPPSLRTPLTSVLDLTGETTLAEAQRRVGFPLLLPTEPADLGSPSRVFVQDIGGPVVVFVWLDPAHPDRVRLSLHQLGPEVDGQKGLVATRQQAPAAVRETTVRGQPAVWFDGPHVLQFRRRGVVVDDFTRLVQGHVLLWEEGGRTIRLETELSLAEAVRIAESLRPMTP